jgi:type 2 lantibiotic biosynthesis protein LanM
VSVSAAALDEARKATLLGRASTLDERGALDLPGDDDGRVDARLAAWRRTVAKGDAVAFARCLAWQGLDEPAARRRLVPPRVAPHERWPEWVELLDAAMALPEPAPDEVAGPWSGLVHLARKALAADLVRRARVAPAALATLEGALARWIAYLSRQTFDLESSVLALRHGAGARRLPSLAALTEEYPVLARQVATLALRWTATTTELLERLGADREAIAGGLGDGRDPGEVVEIWPGLSDPHDGGRSVAILRFSSGLRCVYKPRAVGMDLAFQGLLAWLGERGAPVPFRTVRYVDRARYAWVEVLEHAPARDDDELAAYCRSAGALLAVAYLLDATDLHDGNLFAIGPHAVAIDLETLLSPHPRSPASGETAEWRAMELLRRSVLRSALLPTWRFGPGGEKVDVGGLAPLCGTQGRPWYPRSPESNPFGSDERDRPPSRALVELVVDGFERTYRFLAAQKDSLGAPDGPLAAFADQRVRSVFRDTQLYIRLVDRAFHPDHLRDGADFGIALEALKRLLHVAVETPPYLRVLEAEVRELTSLDVPYFWASTSGADLHLDGGRQVTGFFRGAALGEVFRRTAALGEDDLARQTALTRVAFETPLAGEPHVAGVARAEEPPGAAAAPDEALVAAAQRLGEETVATAVEGDDGSLAWTVLAAVESSACFRLEGVGLDLASGAAGIAVLLEALGRVDPSPRWASLARRALQPLFRGGVRGTGEKLEAPAELGLGTSSGLGGMLYAIARCRAAGVWSDASPAELELAQRTSRSLAGFVSAERLAGETRAGILDGAAGAVLGLLALHGVDPGAGALEAAALAGRRLVALRGPERWPLRSDAGFGDGHAGVACALGRLAAATGEESFASAAREALAVAVADRAPGVGWCRGRVGLGLALLELGDTAGLLDGILEETAGAPASLDSACCGNAARVELLLQAGRLLGRPHLVAAARAEAGALLARSAGWSVVPGHVHSRWTPGLFLGRAGLAVTFLRVAAPGTVAPFLSLGLAEGRG